MKTVVVKYHYKSCMVDLVGKFLRLIKRGPQSLYGLTLGTHVWMLHEREEIPDKYLWHEAIHVAQYTEYGIWGYLKKYYWEDRNMSYRHRTFEVEAYRFQKAAKEYLILTYPSLDVRVDI